MNMQIGDKVLITADNWFYAPDGQQYRAVFGTVKAIETDSQALGIQTNRHSTNWYIQVGEMVIAGCQIHYAIKTEQASSQRYEHTEGSKERSHIFFADEV